MGALPTGPACNAGPALKGSPPYFLSLTLSSSLWLSLELVTHTNYRLRPVSERLADY